MFMCSLQCVLKRTCEITCLLIAIRGLKHKLNNRCTRGGKPIIYNDKLRMKKIKNIKLYVTILRWQIHKKRNTRYMISQ